MSVESAPVLERERIDAAATPQAVDAPEQRNAPPTTPRARASAWAMVLAIAAMAWAVHLLWGSSASMVAIVAGTVVGTLLPLKRAAAAEAGRIVRWLVPTAIVLKGAGLDLAMAGQVGAPALIIIVAGILSAIGAAWLAGRLLRLRPRATFLIGVGTAFCGNSAIFAVAPIIRADEDDMGVAVGTVNLYGLLVMLALPALGALLAMSAHAFGVWAGVSVHAVPQAIAAGFAFGDGAGELAALVKLVRVAMLAPAAVLIAVLLAKGHDDASGAKDVHPLRLVPWFVWGFVGVALLNTMGWLDWGAAGRSASQWMTLAGSILFAICMAAIGLGIDLRSLVRTGAAALVVGLLSALALAGVTLALIEALL